MFRCYGFEVIKGNKELIMIYPPITFTVKSCKSGATERQLNENGKEIKCEPWQKADDTYKEISGNHCINPNKRKKDWCYCSGAENSTTGKCSRDARVGSANGAKFEYCKNSCSGKFAMRTRATSDITIKSDENVTRVSRP